MEAAKVDMQDEIKNEALKEEKRQIAKTYYEEKDRFYKKYDYARQKTKAKIVGKTVQHPVKTNNFFYSKEMGEDVAKNYIHFQLQMLPAKFGRNGRSLPRLCKLVNSDRFNSADKRINDLDKRIDKSDKRMTAVERLGIKNVESNNRICLTPKEP
jgi:hypothetical protein